VPDASQAAGGQAQRNNSAIVQRYPPVPLRPNQGDRQQDYQNGENRLDVGHSSEQL